jgi:hypothetical protein
VVLEPLKQTGLLDYESKGTGGGKTSLLWTTDKFRADVLEPFIERAVQSLDPALTAYYRRSPATIYEDLGSSSTFVKGQALEAYAVHIMRLLGLRFEDWRKRAQDSTGGAEIDVIMSGPVGGLPTRWQIQCKNTPAGRVTLEDVAKEIGLLPLTRASHVMVLANCLFTADAESFARRIMQETPTLIFLLDRNDFERVRESPGQLAAILREKGASIADIRRGTVGWQL